MKMMNKYFSKQSFDSSLFISKFAYSVLDGKEQLEFLLKQIISDLVEEQKNFDFVLVLRKNIRTISNVKGFLLSKNLISNLLPFYQYFNIFIFQLKLKLIDSVEYFSNNLLPLVNPLSANARNLRLILDETKGIYYQSCVLHAKSTFLQLFRIFTRHFSQ